jgi:2-amino-4-hydroxy-6-hydroxymethyldihydropteridine diphosphokinase
LGSNIEPEKNIRLAVKLLSWGLEVTAISTVYMTKAEKRPNDPDYYNCVAQIRTVLDPHTIKDRVLRPIEMVLGRKRTKDRYASRTIDLDLILYDDLISRGIHLVLPDPDIASRPYLAIPLRELSPHMQIPGMGAIGEIAEGFDPNAIKALPGFTQNLRREISHGRKGGRSDKNRGLDNPTPHRIGRRSESRRSSQNPP